MKLGMTLSAALVASVSWASMGAAQTELSMWYHGAGNEAESAALNMIIDDFNASQSEYTVVVESFPQESYNDSVVAAALAGNLPDILDVDGPVMPNWAWAGYLQPLNIDEAVIENFLDGPQGYWDGQLYSIGFWDAAVLWHSHRASPHWTPLVCALRM